MSLYDFLISPLVTQPTMQKRLAGPALALEVGWKRHALSAEYRASVARLGRHSIDLLWAGHLPQSIGQSLRRELSMGRCALGGADRRDSVKNRLPYLPLSGLSAELRNSLTAGSRIQDEYLESHLVRISKALASCSPAALVMTANYDPAMRLVGLAARRAGISVALYGHGISSPKYYLSMDGGISSHFLCWHEEERREYTALGVPEERSSVVGPLRSASDRRSGTTDLAFDILWLGNRVRGPHYTECLSRLIRICSGADLRFAYRPHPLEDYSDVMQHVTAHSILSPSEPIARHLSRARVVVGGGTTGLIEAKMQGCSIVFLRDQFPVVSESISDHLSEIADVVTSCDSLNLADLDMVENRSGVQPYKSPSEEIPLLVKSGWFSTQSGSSPMSVG
jgi:hypothetical protein